MKPALLVASAALAVTLLGAASASALERSGTTTIEVEGMPTRQRTFKTTFDPATGAFSREGSIGRRDGRSITYRMEGTCKKGAGCAWTGTGTGPAGGKWTGEGEIKLGPEREVVAIGTLKGPGGRTIKVNRKVSGDDVFAEMRAAL